LCIVDKGRAGKEARLRLDSKFNLIEEGNTMKFKIGDKEHETSQEVADHIAALMQTNATLTTGKADAEAKLSAATTQITALKADAEKVPALTKQLETATGRADAAEAKVKTLEDPAKFNDQVKARIALIESAKPLLDEVAIAKLDSMTDIDVMKLAIVAKDAEIKLDGKSEDYVRAAFEFMTRDAKKKIDAGDGGLGAGINGARKADAMGECDPKTGMPMNGGKVPLKDKWKQPLTA
jgi:hypothetical protein